MTLSARNHQLVSVPAVLLLCSLGAALKDDYEKTPPPPPPSCPDGWFPHAPGLWANPTPSDEKGDRVNTTATACAKKCALTTGCLAFEIYQLAPKACYIFIGHLQEPFTPNPACFACVSKHAHVRPPPTPPPPPSSTVLINTSALGLPFEGIGGLNGGNGARLIANYPEPQRSDVLDLLFKPGVGCALDILKVELGADGLAANAGGEPAIRHSKGGPLAFNGTNFFLMREAVKRNRNITLYALSWSFPGWFAGRNALGIDQAEYSADWVDGVRNFHDGKVIVGVWNEQDPKASTANYAKLLRKTLDSRGHTEAANVHVLWPDSVNHDGDWDSIAAMVNADPALEKAVQWLGSHYPADLRTCPVSALSPTPNDYRSTCAEKGQAALTKKPLVDSEAWGAGPKDEGNDIGGATMARMLNWEPIVGRISATVVWQILWGSYDGISWANHSLIRAASPWSGVYKMPPPGYAVAHHTRFSTSGWRYCEDDQGNGWLPGGGSYVTRVSPNGRDFSIVLETMSPDKSCSCDTCGDNGGPPARSWSVAETQHVTLHVKSPNCSGRTLSRVESQPFAAQPSWFRTLPQLQLNADCVLHLTLAKDTQLTLSTLPMPSTGAPRTGKPALPPTQETAFPLPWRADFGGPSGEPSGMASFFQDLNGAFALASPFDGGGEPVMEQVSRYVPIMWYSGCSGESKLPLTIFGDQWANVSVFATVALVAPPINDPYGFNSSYGVTKPQAAGAPLTGEQCCTADGPPLDCAWANTSATVAVRVGGGAPSWVKTGYGYFFTVSATGTWQLMASGALPPPPPPFPRQPCPAHGWKQHASGFWANSDPKGGHGDTGNATVPLCAKKCEALDSCLAFEVFDGTSGANGPACYVFLDALVAPFTAQPECITCVKVKGAELQETTESKSETRVKVRILAGGRLPSGFGLRTWHNISLAVAGCELKGEVDGVIVADATDVGCNATQGGYAAVGSGWHAAQFREVSAAPV